MSSYAVERDPESWREKTLDSIAAPPLPVAVFFVLFITIMYFTNYSDYRETVERSKMGLRLYLFLLPILVIAGAYVLMFRRRLWRDLSRPVPAAEGVGEDWSLPWGVVVMLVLVLVLVHYQPPFQSGWFRVV